MEIRPDKVEDPRVIHILERHFETMLAASPPGACHFLDLDGLRQDDISFWVVWDRDAEHQERALGCVALKQLDPAFGSNHGEIKSMHVLKSERGRGLAAFLLEHLLAEAHKRGLTRLSLETGTSPQFEAAVQLYEKYGFEKTGAFSDYQANDFSLFMTKSL